MTFIKLNVIICVSNETLLIGEFMDKKQYLKDKLFLFHNINEIDIQRLLSLGEIKEEHFTQGQTLQSCKNHCKIGIVVNGKAIIKSGEGGVIIKKLSTNDIYGVASLFDVSIHLTSVVAVTDCTVLTMDKAFVEACIKENNQVAMNYIEFLAKRINFLNRKINAYTAKSAENKLYMYLLQLPREENTINLPFDMSTIAKMLGIGRATLYRAFDKLEQNGAIIKQDKKIILKEV